MRFISSELHSILKLALIFIAIGFIYVFLVSDPHLFLPFADRFPQWLVDEPFINKVQSIALIIFVAIILGAIVYTGYNLVRRVT